jgi:hypothetical protein
MFLAQWNVASFPDLGVVHFSSCGIPDAASPRGS